MQKSIDLVMRIYQITRVFPREEDFGLKAQLRRAAVSVPSNIAEGLTRSSKKDKLHFLNVAQSSLSEIDAQCEISYRLHYLDENVYKGVEEQLSEVQMLLNGLARSIRA